MDRRSKYRFISIVAINLLFFIATPLLLILVAIDFAEGSALSRFLVYLVIAIIIFLVVLHIVFDKRSTNYNSLAAIKTDASIDETLERIDNMDGYQFEEWCAELLKKCGYRNVRVTKGSGDQGVDIIAYRGSVKCAIQCKRYHNKVGNKPVQEVYTGKTIYGCGLGIVITNSYYSDGAKKAAYHTGVELWDRTTIIKLLKAIRK